MPKRSLMEQLDQAIEAMLLRPDGATAGVDPALEPLLRVAEQLRDLPSPDFKARLKSQFERKLPMATATEPLSALHQTATPLLRFKHAAEAIAFYKKAFGAKELMRFENEEGVGHAEIAIGNSVISLSDEAPEWGAPGPETLGGSPVSMTLYVDDAQAFFDRAVAAGARAVASVHDEFYGARSGQVADPFGYIWTITQHKEDMSVEEMHRRFNAMREEQAIKRAGESPIPPGYHTITPYLVVQDAPGLIDFAKRAFGAEERFRSIGSAGGVHAEVRVGDSMMMIGGGGAGLSWQGKSIPAALHLYVQDADAVYRRALEAGATSVEEPVDQFYGDREAGVRDPGGNLWWIATHKEGNYIPEGLRSVTVSLHPLRAEPLISYLKRAFGAQEIDRYASPDGVIHHATVRLGDSVLEMGEAHGVVQPMPTMFYLYVPDVDATYRRAMQAGGTSLGEPKDQPYGDRSGGVQDPFGNQWYIATHFKDVAP